MSIKVAINGFGRIGRLAFRLMFDQEDFEIVAINDAGNDPKLFAHLLKYDTAQGAYKVGSVDSNESELIVDGKHIPLSAQRDPSLLPWKELGVDVVIESTGRFTKAEEAALHIKAGAKKVIISAPGKGEMKTVVYNINHDILDGSETVISGASCTTNCLAPVAKVLDDKFGMEMGYMTTVHAYTNDQVTLDGPHKDHRRARTAAANIIPTTTGAASAVGLVLPNLKGKLDGIALRVPVITGSLIDLTFKLKKEASVEQINEEMKKAANETLGVTDEPIVSSDIIGMSYGGLVDLSLTQLIKTEEGVLYKVIAWYDNEMSYTNQLVRLTKYFGNL